jgi:hypothetical protein
VSHTTLQRWKRELLSGKEDSVVPKQAKTPEILDLKTAHEELDATNSRLRDARQEFENANADLYRARLELELLTGAAELIKKDLGVSLQKLKKREKTKLIDALKTKFLLKTLLSALKIVKNSYFYSRQATVKSDKYSNLRTRIREACDENKSRYGYRRIHSVIVRSGSVVSEKVVLRLMNEEDLAVIAKKARKCSSYQGEVSPEVPNLLERDFYAENRIRNG